MRAKGIAYDTGFISKTSSSVERFHPERVRRELTIIRDDLHCTAVQIVGGDPERLEIAARQAGELGLEVWFSPYPLELPNEEILALLVDCADRAERLRAEGAEVVFVTGVELSVMNRDFFDGDSLEERLGRLLTDPEGRGGLLAEVNRRLDGFLRQAVDAVRRRFAGKITYAAVPFERVDWDLFDIVTLELIPSADALDQLPSGVRDLVAHARPKPLVVSGFATATWRGASRVAPHSLEILVHDATTGAPLHLDSEYERDEAEQAAYLRTLLEVFDGEGVDGTFVHLFALPSLPHRPDGDPRHDLDLASPGIVKAYDDRNGLTYPDMPWEPKEAFAVVAAQYAGPAPRSPTHSR